MKNCDLIKIGFNRIESDLVLDIAKHEINIALSISNTISIPRQQFSTVKYPYYYILRCVEDEMERWHNDYPHSMDVVIESKLVGTVEKSKFQPNIEVLYNEFLRLDFNGTSFTPDELLKEYKEENPEKIRLRRVLKDLEDGRVSSVTYGNTDLAYAESVYNILGKSNFLRFYFPENDFRKDDE